MRCANCGAAVAAGTGRFCSHCGAVLADAPRLRADEYRTHGERYAAVRAAAGYPDAMAHDPGRGVPILAFIVPVVMMCFGAVFLVGFMSSAPRGMQLFGGVFMVVWFGILGFMLRRIISTARAPLERVIAVVVNRRTSVSSHMHDGHHQSSTSYYVTLEREDGDRAEYAAGGALAGLVSDADIGVAYVKKDLLIDFRRFDA